jgi:superfamily I DNA and/or RNA helicase
MILTSYFNFKNDDNIIDLFKQIHSHKKSILHDLYLIETIPNSIRNLLQKSSSLEEFHFQIHFSIWKKCFGNLEIPTRAIQKEWIQSALRYEKMKLQKSKSNASDIIRKIKDQFDYYHKIIETPKRKLNSEEQQLKSELKNGKNILVKEFGKSRQHIGLRQLYESDAKKWVFALKPILMMHPHRIATYFPADPGLFDLGIIDEASQMPFSNAIGTLQRVKRVLIAGDENQMDPSHFFSSNDNEHSVFHQAKYHLHNAELTHHYRSESEELISFSNRFFYENKLRFIESANSDSKKRVIHHYVNNGNYHDGVNENEAQDVCDFMISRIQNINTDLSIGIVAFSEAQLKTIIKKIPSQFLPLVDELHESNRLFFKTLDQVQGDECDLLIISFGYGKNKDGNFEMRFGPINQLGGEKRLNVLFSRAKKENHFFSSVKYVDFAESKNDAVNIFKQWFAFLEESNVKNLKSYEIHVLDILEESRDVDDFTHLIYLYDERGWKILTS